jgi:pimeloyl-ACP methyl ester carboxylesterase
MKLHFSKYGEGKPMLIFHGLFGTGDNWTTHAKKWAEQGFCVYTIDQRNHGRSFHSDEMNYKLMCEDAIDFIASENLRDVILLGHSMGGKTVMHVAQEIEFLIEKLIVVDMGVKHYPRHHDAVFEALRSVPLDEIESRGEAEDIFAKSSVDKATQLFLLKNLYWKEPGKLDWRFNLNALEKHIEEILAEVPLQTAVQVPTLFIKGELSNYILNEDLPQLEAYFPKVKLTEVKNSGHWPHAESPDLFFQQVLDFSLNG